VPSSLEIVPAQGGSASVSWTSPYSAGQQVSVSGTVAASNGVLCGTDWSLASGGSTIASGSGSSTLAYTPTVAAGGELTLTITDATMVGYSAACDTNEVSLTITAPGTAPTVTLTAPPATITAGQPTYTGSAAQGFGADPTVTVDVYSGSTVTGSPLQTLTTTASGGSYSVAPSSALPNGTYTAQATQSDEASPADVGSSQPATFQIQEGGGTAGNPPGAPAVTLDSFLPGPLEISAPTLTGTASTGSGYADSVEVGVFSGDGTSGQPVRALDGEVASDGTFSIEVTPALPDGQYTAVAEQLNAAGTIAGYSSPVVFSILTQAPALTLTDPAPGGTEPQSALVFKGAAGSVYGDSQYVDVTLSGGASAAGTPLGSMTVTQFGGDWTARWSRKLPLGIYTVLVRQHDQAGQTTTQTSTFLLTPAPTVIGALIQVTQGGLLTAPISCLAASGVCTGTLVIATRHAVRQTRHSPASRLRIVSATLTIPAGDTDVIPRQLTAHVLAVLRRVGPQPATVTVRLASSSSSSSSSAAPRTYTATRTVTIG
jgi:hypothetical protein